MSFLNQSLHIFNKFGIVPKKSGKPGVHCSVECVKTTAVCMTDQCISEWVQEISGNWLFCIFFFFFFFGFIIFSGSVDFSLFHSMRFLSMSRNRNHSY